MKASNNPFPSALFAHTSNADVASPAVYHTRLLFDGDGVPKYKNSAGAVSTFGGDITTDGSWAASGDLIVGSGENTASILTLSASSNAVLSVTSNALGYADVGTSTWAPDSLNASAAPSVSNDFTQGWRRGSRWIDTVTDKEYVCLDESTGAAVWTETTGGGGGGAVATDAIWTTVGKVAVATGTATATEQYPPGYEFAYNQITANVTIAGADEANATTIVTASEVTFDGSTAVVIEFFAAAAYTDNQANAEINFFLYDGSTSLGLVAVARSASTSRWNAFIIGKQRLTPSAAAHTYSIRASESTDTDDAVVQAGAGGSGATSPAYIRITKA